MKKIKNIMVIALASMLLSACGESSNSTSSDTPKEDWSEDIKSEMLSYCGEVLPYPQGMLSGEISFELTYDANFMQVLQIADTSSSFTLADWYLDLEQSDWNVIKDYSGNVLQANNDSYFVELTKANSDGVGLDISYFYDKGSEATEDEEAVPAGNVIWIYNTFVAEATENTTWTDEEASTIKSTLTETLPMLPMGAEYTVYQRSDDQLIIYDEYIIDNRDKAEKVLESNGFDFERDLSKQYNSHILSKMFDDGSYILAMLLYSSGNYFQFMYSAKEYTVTSWPTEVFANIKTKTGITVPEFSSSDITSYNYYTKGDKVTIYAKVGEDTTELETNYAEAIKSLNLIYDDGTYRSWDETFAMQIGYSYSDDYSETYFVVIASVTEPTSSFSKGWPKDVISSTLKALNVNLDAPELTFIPDDGRDIKYTVEKDYDALYTYWYAYIKEYGDWLLGIDTTDEEAVKKATEATVKEFLGVFITISDPDFKAYMSYYQTLTDLGWHKETNNYDQTIFEDPTGALAIYLSGANYITNINICIGSGKAHTPSLSFQKDEITLGVNTISVIKIDSDMIVGDIAYSSDKEEDVAFSGGYLLVKSDANVGDIVTVTATGYDINGNIYTDTMIIEIAEVTPYDYESAANAVASAYNTYASLEGENAISSTYDSYDDCYGFEINLGSDVIAEDIMSVVETNLIPERFTMDSAWEETTDDSGNIIYTTKYSCDGVQIIYKVTNTDGVILLYAYAFNTSSSDK